MLGRWFSAAASVVYLLLDRFTTTESAPLASPRTCEPGPGQLTITDTNNVMSIASARLTVNGTATGNDGWILTTSLARAIGRALLATIPTCTGFGSGNTQFGWVSTSAITGTNVCSLSTQTAGLFYMYDIPGSFGSIVVPSGPPYDVGVILRSTGVFIVCRGASGGYELIWVSGYNNATPLYPRYRLSGNNIVLTYDDACVVDLGGVWADDYGIATNRIANPSSGATTTSTADALVEFTWTPIVAETLELDVRRTDADNRWIVRCSQVGSTIKLIERNAGVETERASASQSWLTTSTYRIVVVMTGTDIRVVVSTSVSITLRNTYSSATFNQAATGIAVAGFTSGSNLVCWPRAVTLPSV